VLVIVLQYSTASIDRQQDGRLLSSSQMAQSSTAHPRYQGTDESTRIEYPETNIVNAVDKACLPDLNYRAPEYHFSGLGEVSKTCRSPLVTSRTRRA
jgi:hypothetical protein